MTFLIAERLVALAWLNWPFTHGEKIFLIRRRGGSAQCNARNHRAQWLIVEAMSAQCGFFAKTLVGSTGVPMGIT